MKNEKKKVDKVIKSNKINYEIAIKYSRVKIIIWGVSTGNII